MPSCRRALAAALIGAAALGTTAIAQPAAPISAAEQALFTEPSLQGIKPPRTLTYRFARQGSLEPAFNDTVTLKLSAQPGGACCAADVGFLTGSRQVTLPPIDLADANPVLLGFLEHDIREMERMTGGKANYFRKRIRMALSEGPALQPRTLRWQGQDVAGTEISIAPFAQDPMRARYAKLADKRYVFWRSAAVPGRLYGARTEVANAADAGAPLITTELWLDGAQAVPLR